MRFLNLNVVLVVDSSVEYVSETLVAEKLTSTNISCYRCINAYHEKHLLHHIVRIV